MLKKTIASTLISTLLIVLNGCTPSEADLLKEKQNKERLAKIQLDKAQRLKEQKLKEDKLKKIKYQEAKKYLSKPADNSLIYPLLYKYNKEFQKTLYETKQEYQVRISLLNQKVFSKKFIIEYQREYNLYDPTSKILYLSFRSQNTKATKAKTIMLVKKKIYNPHNKLDSYQYLSAPLNLRELIYVKGKRKRVKDRKTRRTTYKDTYKDIYTIVKTNCSGSEAQYINDNLAVKVIATLKHNGRLKGTPFNSDGTLNYREENNLATIDMIIVYNQKTNEIYKVLY